MRWDDFRRSDNVEDTRGDEGGFGGGGIGNSDWRWWHRDRHRHHPWLAWLGTWHRSKHPDRRCGNREQRPAPRAALRAAVAPNDR